MTDQPKHAMTMREICDRLGHVQPDLKPLAPLARVIADTVQNTPIRLGSPEGAVQLIQELILRTAAYMGHELGPDAKILGEIQAERARQDARWGEQNHPDGTGGIEARRIAEEARRNCQAAADRGTVTWLLISDEEHCEALAESDPLKLRAELIQDAAVKVAWIAAIDRRLAAANRGDRS